MAEVKSIGEFYDPTKTLNAYVGMQHVALQNQQLQQQQANMEIDNLKQAAQMAVTENPSQAAGPWNAYMGAVGGPQVTDANAFVANPKPFWDQLNFPPGSKEWQEASTAIDTMGVSTQKRSRAEFERQGMLQGAGELITQAGGEATPGMKSFMAQSEQGQRQVTEAIFDPSKQAVAEMNKEHMAQKAGINAELHPLLDLGVDSGRALKEMAALTPQIAAIQAQYEKDKPTLGITKAAGKRQDAVLGNADLTAYRARAAESVPKIDQALAQVKQEIDQATKDAHHLFAGTKPQTTDDSVHVIRGTMNALKLKEQYLEAVRAQALDPLNPTKHQAVAQLTQTMDARAGELYQSRTALDVRRDAAAETARQHEIANQYTNATAQGQRTFGALPAKAQTTEAAAKIAAELKQSTGVDVKVEDILIKDPNRPQLQVAFNQEKQEAKTVGEAFGEQYNTSQKAGMAATSKLNKLDRMDSLLSGITTGKLTPAITDIQAIAESFGVTVDKTLAGKQAMQALSREMALELRNPSGGAGMPGAMSDQDREFLQSMTPNLSQTNEGNKMIIDTARKVAKRDQDIAKLARTYRKQHGHLDEGFYDEVQAYGDAHPMFKGQKAPGEASTMTPGVPQFHDPEKQKRYEDWKKKHTP